MKIQVVCRHEDIPPVVPGYVREKMEGVERFGEEFERLEVILDLENGETLCEAILHRHRGEPLVAHDRSRDPRAAVDGAEARLERQVVRNKEKHSRKGRCRAS